MARALALSILLLMLLGGSVAAAQEPACGGLLQPACPPPATTPPPAPAPPPTTTPAPAPTPKPKPPAKAPEPAPVGNRLLPAQFELLERYYTANAGRSSARYLSACRAIATAEDPLLRAIGLPCTRDRFAGRAQRRFAKCRAFAACLSAVRQLSGELTSLHQGMQRSNRLVRQEVPGRACRTAMLIADRDLRVYGALARAWRSAREAYEARSQSRFDRAARRIEAVRFGSLRTPGRSLQLFLAGCEQTT